MHAHPRAGGASTRPSSTSMLEKVEQSEGIERRGLVLATMTKLKQVCNHPAHAAAATDSPAGPLRQARPGRGDPRRRCSPTASGRCSSPSSRSSAACSAAHLSARFGREVLFLHGGVPKKARDAMVARFQSDRSAAAPAVFVLSLKAGGTGLNLTAANHVIHYDRWWNPAVEDQATDRAFRIGQARNVQVRKLVCAGTIEERIAGMIEREARTGRRGSSAPARAGSPSCRTDAAARARHPRRSGRRIGVATPTTPGDQGILGRGREHGDAHASREFLDHRGVGKVSASARGGRMST